METEHRQATAWWGRIKTSNLKQWDAPEALSDRIHPAFEIWVRGQQEWMWEDQLRYCLHSPGKWRWLCLQSPLYLALSIPPCYYSFLGHRVPSRQADVSSLQAFGPRASSFCNVVVLHFLFFPLLLSLLFLSFPPPLPLFSSFFTFSPSFLFSFFFLSCSSSLFLFLIFIHFSKLLCVLLNLRNLYDISLRLHLLLYSSPSTDSKVLPACFHRVLHTSFMASIALYFSCLFIRLFVFIILWVH